MADLPEIVRSAAGIVSWPTDPSQRAVLLRGLRGDAKRDLYAWAHAEAGGCPTIAAWAAVLGVSQGTLKSLRSHDAVVGALPTRGRVYARRAA